MMNVSINKYPLVKSLSILLLFSGVHLAWGQLSGPTPSPLSIVESSDQDDQLPSPHREFRAAWVATIHNLDWPSRPGLSVYEMRRETIAILDRLEELNMNAVILQVRPHGDALYKSDLEPWSCYLTGKQGVAPTGGFDPLEFWIEEAHQRGIQLHAWFNPYRVYHHSGFGEMSEDFILKRRPDLLYKLKKSGFWWMDPSKTEAREHTLNVVMDVVNRYDIDGVHFDDYFYPYPAYNGGKSLPDYKSFKKYQDSGGKLELADWRRSAVNSLISDVSRQIKATKPAVEFGISPFGIWKPGYPEEAKGFDAFSELYADSRLWLAKGWVDYLMPQLYWPINAPHQSFPTLLEWWHGENQSGRHVWPGIRLTHSVQETINKIEVVREQKGSDSGMALFSMKGLMNNTNRTDLLKTVSWQDKAVIPASGWNPITQPLAPELFSDHNPSNNRTEVHIFPRDKSEVFLILINEKRRGQWQTPQLFTKDYHSHYISSGTSEIAVRIIDRSRNIGRASYINIDPSTNKFASN